MKKSFEYYKELSVEMWTFLHENPELLKEDFKRYNEVSSFLNFCPLCEKYFAKEQGKCSEKCPLVLCSLSCFDDDHIYNLWASSVYPEIQQAASLIILNSIKAWKK